MNSAAETTGLPGIAVPLRTPKILAEVRDGVGWLTFNQPERRNAISLEMWEAIGDAAAAFEADARVRVIVMHGAGGRSFAAGADISEFEQHRANAAQKDAYARTAGRAHHALAGLNKPLIAMVEGHCIGGGMALALTADLRFATAASSFGIPAARLGLGYDYPGVAALARLVGPSAAKDILFSARLMDAERALQIGLVNAVLPDGDALRAHVQAYAAQIAANAPLTLRAAKAAVRLFEQASAQADDTQVAALVSRCFDSDDYREGRQAFMDKRRPQFTGT